MDLSPLSKFMRIAGCLAIALIAMGASSEAVASTVNPETAYILNTLLFLFCGVLVMFMAAGFMMLEAGMVRHTSVATIILKNISLYAVAGLMFFLMGYSIF